MVKVAICTEPPLLASVQAVIAALRGAGHEPVIFSSPHELLERADHGFDCGWVRITPQRPHSDEPPLYWQAAQALEGLGVPLLNSTAAQERSNNKFLTHVAFDRAGVKQPRTWLLPPEGADIPDLGEGPFICKPVFGSKARGVMLVDDLAEAHEHEAEEARSCLLQQFIPGAAVVRVVATPDRSVRAYEKTVGAGGGFAAIAQGAVRTLLRRPDPRLLELAQNMVAAVGGGLMGVDILVNAAEEMWGLETNASFQFDERDKVIAAAFVDELARLAGR